jgi:hypothetical protein
MLLLISLIAYAIMLVVALFMVEFHDTEVRSILAQYKIPA